MPFKYTDKQSIDAIILVMKHDGGIEYNKEDAKKLWERIKGNRKSRSWLFERYEELIKDET